MNSIPAPVLDAHGPALEPGVLNGFANARCCGVSWDAYERQLLDQRQQFALSRGCQGPTHLVDG
jgi:hypothetical protein